MPDYFGGYGGFDPYGGGYPSITYGEGPWWGASINRGIDILPAIFGDDPYVSPDDPRYRAGQQSRYPVGANQIPYQQGGAGINLSTNTLMLIGGAILIWMVASRRR